MPNAIDRQILRIALPAIVSNITVPLLGLVDVAIAGHLGSAAYIGAVAVGGMVFNVAYWLLGFLRMGTSGLTAQAFGRRDLSEVVRLLVRSLGIGLAAAALLLLLQHPLRQAALALVGPPGEVRRLAAVYFDICIWGAPAMLGLYAFTGWYIGMQNSRIPMLVAITQNVVNIVASLLLVYAAGLKVEGVALGTLIAQWAGFLMAAALWAGCYGRLRRHAVWRGLLARGAMRRFFAVNRDIFLRTLCLVAVTLFFTSAGARQGEVVLAVNALLMQLFTLYSYVMDGFAYAGEALSGRLIGACNRPGLRLAVGRLFAWGGIMAAAFTLAYALGGDAFLSLLTDEPHVVRASHSYVGWALVIPLAGTAAFVWDGVFIGATATRAMLLSMSVAAATFFLVFYLLAPALGNHALWLAFLLYLLVRGLVQTGLARSVERKAFGNQPDGHP